LLLGSFAHHHFCVQIGLNNGLTFKIAFGEFCSSPLLCTNRAEQWSDFQDCFWGVLLITTFVYKSG